MRVHCGGTCCAGRARELFWQRRVRRDGLSLLTTLRFPQFPCVRALSILVDVFTLKATSVPV